MVKDMAKENNVEDRRIIYDGDWKDGQKHGQGFEGGGDGIQIRVNYENGVKIN